MSLIRRAARRALRCRCRLLGRSWRAPIRSTFASPTRPHASPRPASAGRRRFTASRAWRRRWRVQRPEKSRCITIRSPAYLKQGVKQMAARSIATLTVSFGLVSIPVKLFSATEASRAISFNLLHKTCGSRLKQQYFCVKEEVPVAREDMAKGYEFAKDQYVMFTPEELKALEEAGTPTADITEFVPSDS